MLKPMMAFSEAHGVNHHLRCFSEVLDAKCENRSDDSIVRLPDAEQVFTDLSR